MGSWRKYIVWGLCLLGGPIAVQAQDLIQVYRHKSLDLMEKSLYGPFVQPSFSGKNPSVASFFADDASLFTSGSLSRGITVGNARDMSVDSYLNLQMQGMLSDRLSLSAHISDRSIPLQTASTRQWQEFDRIYIRLDYLPLDKVSARLLAGDVDLADKGTYFARFSRQGMGMQASVLRADTLSGKIRSDAFSFSESVAKGSFCRQQLTAREGVQGGYRLQGANGERQIMVLSASEKVYIDGVLLQRGEDADYTIDYNLAEITFTARQPITKDKRIVVEFEYADQQYVRSLTHWQSAHRRQGWEFVLDFYNEQDLKRQSNQMDLDASMTDFLKRLDRGGSVYYPYADSAGYLPEEVMYRLTDTLVAGQVYDSVYVYSNNPEKAVYRLRFSYLGEGKGNYVAVQSSVNGQVYAWVAPEGGVPQGAYEPVLLLITPKRLQMYTVKASYQEGGSAFYVETALSNPHANTFSATAASNPGLALRGAYRTRWAWGRGGRSWSLEPSVYYEGKGAAFTPVDAYREVEFLRDYNLSDTLCAQKAEHFTSLSLRLESPLKNSLLWKSTAYLIPDAQWKALRHEWVLREQREAFRLDADVRLLQTRTSDYGTLFLKHKETLSKNVAFLCVGLREDMEWNAYRAAADNALMVESRGYSESSFFLRQRTEDARDWRYRLQYSYRNDYALWERRLQPQTQAQQVQADLEMLRFAQHPLRFSFSYRSLQAKDSLWRPEEAENTLLGSLHYQGRWARGAIQASLFASLGSAMEEKTAYSYLKVADGQGTYQWIDYNGNGIAELDEFEVAVYRDQANYIRVYLMSQEQEKVYANTWTQSLALRPAAVWRDSRGLRKCLSLFSNTFSIQSQCKKQKDLVRAAPAPGWALCNPWVASLQDSLIRTAHVQYRDVFSFHAGHPVYGAEVTYLQTQNKNLTINGFEYNSEESVQSMLRYRFGERLTSQLFHTRKRSASASAYLDSRNYRLEGDRFQGVLQYPVHSRLSLSCAYSYRRQRNLTGAERLSSHGLEAEAVYRMPKRGSMRTQLRYEQIDFTGEAQSPVAYVMMEALSKGANGIAHAAYQVKIGAYLQLDASYEGRFSEQGLRHTGSLSVKAVF
ncbi:MAG: hypothetical protein J5873_04520 [Bacteroidales bacterium]|nr:hypothetical protein [Bacteroidales bacterium]